MAVTLLQNQTWAQIVAAAGDNPNLLVGNGLSISLNNCFQYATLLQEAAKLGLSPRAQKVFRLLETSNFEEVMRSLDYTDAIATTYGCNCGAIPRVRKGARETKTKLVNAITRVHGAYPDSTSISDAAKDKCGDFIAPFHTVYTLNYDLLLYWVWVHAVLTRHRWETGDGFLTGGVYQGLGSGGLRFLHGALHLYTEDGAVKKHTYNGASLLTQITNQFSTNRYPLFIAEGTHAKKRAGIAQSEYLADCFREFRDTGPALVTYGVSFGASDHHLVDAIIENAALKHLILGSHDWPPNNIGAIADTIKRGRVAKGKSALATLAVYQSSGITPWK